MAEEAVSKGGWNPNQYDRFKAEREQPFYDLAALVQRQPGMRVVDLGCGDGRLTAWLHRELEASETLGIDSSPAMLEKSEANAGGGVSFRQMDILDATDEYAGQFDLVFSNAALQWILGHETLFPRIARLVKPGGQFAVQMPANGKAPSHRMAAVVASEEPAAEEAAAHQCALARHARPRGGLNPRPFGSRRSESLTCSQLRIRRNMCSP